jgi:hypothetical protein
LLGFDSIQSPARFDFLIALDPVADEENDPRDQRGTKASGNDQR